MNRSGKKTERNIDDVDRTRPHLVKKNESVAGAPATPNHVSCVEDPRKPITQLSKK